MFSLHKNQYVIQLLHHKIIKMLNLKKRLRQMAVALLYSRLQMGHVMDGIKFEFNDIIVYKKKRL